jgi:hypothetical protein
MRVVCKGHDPAIDRPAARKVLITGQGLVGQERALYRKGFLREARAAELVQDLRHAEAAASEGGGGRASPVRPTPALSTVRLFAAAGPHQRRWLIAGSAALGAVVLLLASVGRAPHRVAVPRAAALAPPWLARRPIEKPMPQPSRE